MGLMAEQAERVGAFGAWARRRFAALDGPEQLRLFLMRASGTFNLYVLCFASIWTALGWHPFTHEIRAPVAGWTFAALCAVALVALWCVPWSRLSPQATLPIFFLGVGGIIMLRLVGQRDSSFTLFFFWLWFAAIAYPRSLTIVAFVVAAGTHLALALTTGERADTFEAAMLLIPCFAISTAAVRVASERLETLWRDRAQARRSYNRSTTLHAFSTLLASEHQIDRLLAALVGGLAERFGYRLLGVYLLDGDRLLLGAQVGYDAPIAEIGLGEGITGEVARQGRPMLVRDGRAHPGFLFAGAQIGSVASVPLVHQGRVLGVLNVEGAAGELVEDDLHLLETLAGPVAVAIRNAHLVRELDDLAHRDPLTHLFNRRGIIGALHEALAEGAARDEPVTILLIDLNKFKAINDRYGHPMGDALLSELAGLLATSVRQTTGRGDAVGRLGGDEFLVVLPGADEAQAFAVIDRLTAILASHTFALLAADDGLPPPAVGYSLGVAVAPRDGGDAAALLAAADRAMYQAKRGSSGAIRFATSPTTPLSAERVAG
jgi:diguanylate cyclase (GGDEF)-like protein